MSGDKTAQEKDIFEDKVKLLEIWKDERRSRDFNASLMWDNLRLFSVLIPAILTIDTLFLKWIYEGSTEEPTGLLQVSLVIPILVVILSGCGIADLYRRWKRTLEAIAHLGKLEDLLGLYSPRENRNIFSQDSQLFQRWANSIKKFDTEKQFINHNIFKFNMFTSMASLYAIFALIGLLLIQYQLGLIHLDQ